MTELIWDGKYKDGKKQGPVRIALPFQTIETVNEGTEARLRSLELFASGRDTGWRNRLIWGDKKYVLPSLLPEFAGKVNLIYIDPPFDTGADFSFTATIPEPADDGGENDSATFTKEPSILEQKAYRDTWGRGLDSYLQWFYETVVLLRELLAENGSIYVHLDWHIAHYAKAILDETFGEERFRNEIAWCYGGGGAPPNYYHRKHDNLFWYSNGTAWVFHTQRRPYTEGTRQRGLTAVKGPEYTLHEKGAALDDFWTDCQKILSPTAYENLKYPTQKPESLLERVVRGHTNEGDLVLDCFVGSGTTAAVAEKLNRRWIACDLGRFAIHTTRKRLLGIRGVKPFAVQNLGKYERQAWQVAEFGGLARSEAKADSSPRLKDIGAQNDSLHSATLNPSPVTLSPSPVTPSPSPVTLSPSPVTPSPSPVILSPSPVTLSPSPVTPSPSPVTLSPSPVTLSPSPVTPSPSPVTLSPSPVTLSPSPVTLSPSPVTPSPSPVTLSPSPVILSGAKNLHFQSAADSAKGLLVEQRAREAAYRQFILELYHATPITGRTWLHGIKSGRMVHVGAVDAPVTLADVKAIAREDWKAVGTAGILRSAQNDKRGTQGDTPAARGDTADVVQGVRHRHSEPFACHSERSEESRYFTQGKLHEESAVPLTSGVDILGWEFAFELNELAKQVAAESRVDVAFKKIPREVLDKKAVEQGDVKFFELGALSVEVRQKANADSSSSRHGGTPQNDKGREVTLKVTDFAIPTDDIPEEARKAIKHWSQLVDYWAVDWDYKNDTFHNQWQSYRTRKDPKIELEAKHTYTEVGRYTVVVKVIDILGNDTTKTVEVSC